MNKKRRKRTLALRFSSSVDAGADSRESKKMFSSGLSSGAATRKMKMLLNDVDPKLDRPTNRPTDRPLDRPTDRPLDRLAVRSITATKYSICITAIA